LQTKNILVYVGAMLEKVKQLLRDTYNGKHPKRAKQLYADRGYVSQKLAEILFVDGIHFVVKMRNNMKGGELPLQDKTL